MLLRHYAVKCYAEGVTDEGRHKSNNLPAQTVLLSYDNADISTG